MTRALWVAVGAVFAFGCRGPSENPSSPATISVVQRDAALARADVWHNPSTPIGRVNFAKNPEATNGFRETDDLECRFVLEKVGGTTPKFRCRTASGETLKVKYGASNMELGAEVAATRLLEALGFYVDRMYLVRSVRCLGCPPFPFEALQCVATTGAESTCTKGADPARAVEIAPAAIERTLPGRKIESNADQGWAWFELDKIAPAAGGASRSEVDALRLIAMLLAHWDNKAENQRLQCPEGSQKADGSCRAPLLVVQDLGATFGPLKIDLQNWRQVRIWSDQAACRVSMKGLPYGGGTFGEHRISEEGRQLAATLLGQISREQVLALFEGSGVTRFDHVLTEARQPEAWASAFAAKVDEISNAGPCPPAATLTARSE